MQRPRPQPALAVLILENRQQKDFAACYGYTTTWVSRVLRGWARPPERFKRQMAEWTGRPIWELFSDDRASVA